MILRLSLFVFIALVHTTFAQTSEELLKGVILKINSVKDYKAEISIKAEIPFVKVPIAKATLYFKQKDKFKVVSKGIAILPKQGVSDLSTFLSNEGKYTSLLGDSKTIGDIKTKLVTVIPNGENSEIILAKIYIDPTESLIYRTVLTTKESGTVTVDYTYGQNKKYGLPNKMTFSVDVKKFKMPKSVASDIRNNEKKTKDKKENKGVITITVVSYEVNKGISDDTFKKD